jgi:hypothetical protein
VILAFNIGRCLFGLFGPRLDQRPLGTVHLPEPGGCVEGLEQVPGQGHAGAGESQGERVAHLHGRYL